MASKYRLMKVRCPIMKDYPDPTCYCDRVALRNMLPRKVRCNDGRKCMIIDYLDATLVDAYFSNYISI
jgi:hypothetical protein